MKIHDLIKEGIVDDVKSSAKKFWHGTSGEIARERMWPMAYEKSMVAYKNAVNSGDFAAIDKYSDLVNYFALKTGKPTLKNFDNRLLRQKWTKQDFVDHVKQQYKQDLDKAEHGGLEESTTVKKKDKEVISENICPHCGGPMVAEIELDESCKPYEYFLASRFAFTQENLLLLMELIQKI